MPGCHRDSAHLATAVLFGFALLTPCVDAAPAPVIAAVNTINVGALETLSQSAPTAQQRALAAGALLALRNEDTQAIAELTSVTRSTAAPVVRATAYLALSNVFLRIQRYRACYSAIRTASRLSPQSVKQDYRQTMAFAHALAHVKTMQLVRESPGSLPITEEKKGLIRVPVTIDGHQTGAMLDTGANFSTITESVAKRFGIRMLSRSVGVNSSTKRGVTTRLGIARRLRFGNAIFKNVLFIVLPDSKLRIPRSFRIDAIIGLPVLMALGRLAIVNSALPTFLYGIANGKSAGLAGAHSNMLLYGLDPLVRVSVPGALNPLLMELDTGSNITYFTHNAIANAPMLFANAERYVWHAGGAGGAVTEHHALRLPQVKLLIEGQPIILKKVVVSSRASSTKDGVLGQDIFLQGARWTMDFRTMTLAVEK